MLAYLPLGWMMKAGGTACWLQGQGEKGLQMIEQMRQKLDHFMRDHRQSFILFPEGTIMKGSEKTKSQAYASRMGFVHLEHLLLPRHKALHIAVQTLAAQGIDELYDVTIHYPASREISALRVITLREGKNTCWRPKPGHQRAQDFCPAPSLDTPAGIQNPDIYRGCSYLRG